MRINLALVVCFALFSFSCGYESPESDNKQVTEKFDHQPINSELVGTWSEPCQMRSRGRDNANGISGPMFYSSSITIEGDFMKITTSLFEDEKCTVKSIDMSSNNEIVVEGLTPEEGYFKINIIHVSHEQTLFNPEKVTMARKEARLDISDWEVGVSQVIDSKIRSVFYDLATIQDGKLCLGRKNALQNGSSNHRRPVKIDFDECLNRDI